MRFFKQPSKVIISRGTLTQPHEITVATILAATGHDVVFIPVRTIPTPDIKYRNLEWEIKSPLGKSSRTLKNNLHGALKQSPNIIVDLSRTKLDDSGAIRELKRQLHIIHGIKHLLVITKSQEVVKLK